MNSVICSIIQVLYWILTTVTLIHYEIYPTELMYWFIVFSESAIILILGEMFKED